MRNYIRNAALGVSAFIIGIFIFGSYVIFAQSAVSSGTWKASADSAKPDEIHISFSQDSKKYGRNNSGSNFKYSDLQGLSSNADGKVNFRLVREAGTIDCEGTFAGGKGNGTFTFAPNASFVSGMSSRGFTFKDDELFAAALLDVTVAVADDLKNSGFGPLDTGDLFKAVIFKISGQYAAEMKATGFPNLSMEDLVKTRIFKIDADYVKQVSAMGFATDSMENLVKLRIFKVTPEFLTDLKNEGFANLSSEQVVKFRIFNIDTDFIRKAKSENPNVTVEEMVQMKIGVRRR